MRRSGVSLKVSDSSATCVICKNICYKSCCFICKRLVCEYCICDNGKYCLYCSGKVNSTGDTIIGVPTEVGVTNYIAIKDKSYCCFM